MFRSFVRAPAANVDVAEAVVHHAGLGGVAHGIPPVVALVPDAVAVLCEAVGLLVCAGDGEVVRLEREDGLLGVQDGRVLELAEGARDGVVIGRAVDVEHALASLEVEYRKYIRLVSLLRSFLRVTVLEGKHISPYSSLGIRVHGNIHHSVPEIEYRKYIHRNT